MSECQEATQVREHNNLCGCLAYLCMLTRTLAATHLQHHVFEGASGALSAVKCVSDIVP